MYPTSLPAYGENQEPFWRAHDSDLFRESTNPPLPTARGEVVPLFRDPDWDDSRWTLGRPYWLGQRHYRQSLWQSIKLLFTRRQYLDGQVRDAVLEALAREPEVDLSDIAVSVKRGVVTLEGSVPDHWMREQAREAIYFLPGVEMVRNRLKACDQLVA